MVFKKPYAFLIKHFKLIHLVLSALLIFLAVFIFKLVGFFNDFASSGFYSATSNLAGKYINFYMYIAVILILAITLFIYMLMKSKKKSTKLYVGLMGYYILIFILLTVSYGILQSLEKEVIDVQMTRLYRDLSLIISLPQLFFIIYSLIRGLGFDLKRFNFQADLKELEISASDSEEIELTVGVETYKAKRYFRRFIREFKYYIMENTFIFICIVSIVGVILGTTLFMNFAVYNKVYKQGQTFAYKNFNVTVNKSYLTNKDTNGNQIGNNYYLILDVTLLNKFDSNISIDTTDFRMNQNKDTIYPSNNKSALFSDLGTPYNGTKIPGLTEKNYIVIFELDSKNVRKSYRLRLLDSINYKPGDIQAKYKEIKVVPERLDEVETIGTYKLNDTVNLKDSLLKNSTIAISGYNITNTYKYNYQFCTSDDNCKESTDIVTPKYTSMSNSTLLVLDYKLNIDDTAKLEKSFFSQFCKIKYKKGKEEYTLDVKNITPSELKGKVVLQVDNKIKTSGEFYLSITIRNKEYLIKIKEKK